MKTNPETWGDGHEGRLAALIDLAIAAGRKTLEYFGDASLAVDRKGDASPVTAADRNAERLIRDRLSQSYPADSILGEEFDDTAGDSGYRWIVDPIDGTKSFICGVPLYSTLVGLEKDGQMIGGVINLPALGEMVAAVVDQGAWHRAAGDRPWSEATVSKTSRLADAVFVTSQVDSFASRGAGDAYLKLESEASITRSWGDAYGYLLVATGRADVMVDPIVSPWDVAAVLPVIREAGGEFTNWKGEPTIQGPDAFGTNGLLHEEVQKILSSG